MSSHTDSPEEQQRARRVHAMFASIALRYDLLNHLLSGNADKRWRAAAVRETWRRMAAPEPRILDLGCGTADLALSFPAHIRVIASDFCQPMLHIARKKIGALGRSGYISLLAADALALPFAAASFDAVVSAFVLRNLANTARGMAEMKRVVRPGGVVGILEFGMPSTPFLGALYRIYFLRILPRIGRLVSGVEGPYRYLPDSVGRFARPAQLMQEMSGAGFIEVDCRLLTGGIAVFLTGRTAESASVSG